MDHVTKVNIEALTWTNEEFGQMRVVPFRPLPDAPASEDVIDIEVFAKHEINHFDLNNDADPSDRFKPTPQPLTDAELLLRAAACANAYTKAIFFDYRHEYLADGKQKRDAGVEAAECYIVAVHAFANSGFPEEHWIVCPDALARARYLLSRYGEALDSMINAATAYVGHIPDHRGLRIVRNVAAAAIHKMKPTQASQASLASFFDLFWTRIDTSGRDSLQLADALTTLAKAAKIPGWNATLADLYARVAMSHAAGGNPLLAAGMLHEAIRRARSVGSNNLPTLLKAVEITNPQVLAAMDTIAVSGGSVDLQRFAPLTDALRNAPSKEDALLAFGKLDIFLRTNANFASQLQDQPRSIVGELVTVVPIGTHGPTGNDLLDVRLIQLKDMFVHQASHIMREVFFKSDLTCFEPAFMADFLIRTGVVEQMQNSSLLRGLEAWKGTDFVAASFVLLPLTEYAFLRACSTLGGHALAMSRTESILSRHGETIVSLVRDNLGLAWECIYEHIWGREGAPRHAYAHGYVEDTRISSMEPDYCVYALLSIAFHMANHQ